MGDGVPHSSLVFLCVILLSLQFCNAEIIYALKGSSPQLPCPCPSCTGKHGMVTWYFNHQEKTVYLLRKMQDHIVRSPDAWDRLQMLQNYSLLFSDVTDNETGRYWCESGNYYDLVTVTGKRRILESCQADITCYILSCYVSKKELGRDVVSWWEGRKQLQMEDETGGYSVFRGQKASQLHICLRKTSKERRVKCRFDQQVEVNFSLTADVQKFCANSSLMPFLQGTVNECFSPQCPKSRGHEGLWIPLAVCVTLQLLIILALGLLLWRRSRSQKHQNGLKGLSKDISKSEYKAQVYENIKT